MKSITLTSSSFSTRYKPTSHPIPRCPVPTLASYVQGAELMVRQHTKLNWANFSTFSPPQKTQSISPNSPLTNIPSSSLTKPRFTPFISPSHWLCTWLVSPMRQISNRQRTFSSLLESTFKFRCDPPSSVLRFPFVFLPSFFCCPFPVLSFCFLFGRNWFPMLGSGGRLMEGRTTF